MLMNEKMELKVAKSKSASKATTAICRAIENLDLEMIKFKLTHPKDYFNWSKEFADEIEIEYKRFLILCAKYPEERIVPGLAVDTFWHQHILDTTKYAEDCQRIFGCFAHHYPYSGLLSEEDEKEAESLRDNSRSRYEMEFGEKPWVERQATRTKAKSRSKKKSLGKVARKKK